MKSTKSAPSRAKRAFKLPTLSAFKRLSFKRKAQVFRDWAATMKGSYDSRSHGNCALSQFGTALNNGHKMEASVRDFYYSDYSGEVVVLEHVEGYGMNSPIFPRNREVTGGPQLSTFASLTRRLDAYIKKHY
jgi:hypothetical protein